MKLNDNKMYRAAIVGLGNIAWRFDGGLKEPALIQTHVSAYLNNPQVELVGGCSPVAEEREQFAAVFGVGVYETIDQLFAETNPDIVSICSPEEFHFAQAEKCIESKIPMVWLEKPPVTSMGEMDKLLTVLSGSSSTILVNYQRRYTHCYRELQKIFHEKMYGECLLIQISYSRGLEINGSHILDMLFFVVGDNSNWQIDWVGVDRDEANPSFILTFAQGTQVIVSGASLPYHCIDIALVCEGARVSVLHGGMTPHVEERVEHELFPGYYRLRSTDPAILGRGGFDGSFENALADLVAAHEEEREPVSSLSSARSVMELISRVRSSEAEEAVS